MKNLFANCHLAQEEAKSATGSAAMKRQSKHRGLFGPLLAWLRRTPLTRKTRPSDEEQQVAAREEGSIRLKLVVTKEEAAQLLALYVEGCRRGVTAEKKLVGFKLQNAGEIRSSFASWRPMLESIPEH